MPISSTQHRLTRELYKPPPKSLMQIRRDAEGGSPNVNSSREGSPASRLTREKHLDSFYGKRTAVVGPVTESASNANGNGGMHGAESAAAVAGGYGQKGATASGPAWPLLALRGCCFRSCCHCHGLCCTGCGWLSFLLGLLLGALICGLIVGLVLDAQFRATSAAADTEPMVGCFQSPCSSANATCAYLANNTQIDCQCGPQVGSEPVSSAGIVADGYRCVIYNNTEATTTAVPVTVIP